MLQGLDDVGGEPEGLVLGQRLPACFYWPAVMAADQCGGSLATYAQATLVASMTAVSRCSC